MNFAAMPLVAQPLGQRGGVVETRTHMTTQMQQTMKMQIRITMQTTDQIHAMGVMAQATAELVDVGQGRFLAQPVACLACSFGNVTRCTAGRHR